MEDYKWIFYLLLAIYFIFRSRKKKTPESNSDQKPINTGSSPTSKPVTFEDLLREIQQSKPTRPEVKTIPSKPVVQQPQYVDYDDDLKSEEQDLEDVNYDYRNDSQSFDTYEKAKKEAFNRPSYEETGTNMEESVIRFNHFKEYGNLNVPSEAENIANELKNPDNIKRAVVLAEILNRRY